MKYREAVAAAALLFAVPGLAFGQAAKVLPGGCGSVDLTGLDTYPLTMNTTGKQCTEGTGGGGASGNVNVTQFGSNNVVTGTGASGPGIPRVTVSNDSTVGLVAGTAIIGKVGIDQTTPGTTNGVQVNAALPAGSNAIGNVGIVNGANQAAVKAASTTPAASDPALVVAFSPNSGVVSTTPAAGTASAIVSGGSATTLVTGPVKGCLIGNPATATDQNIAAAEVGYINFVTTATANGRGTNVRLDPGQWASCPAGMTTNVSAIAATTSHAFSVTVW